jgi:hypothetical protein
MDTHTNTLHTVLTVSPAWVWESALRFCHIYLLSLNSTVWGHRGETTEDTYPYISPPEPKIYPALVTGMREPHFHT